VRQINEGTVYVQCVESRYATRFTARIPDTLPFHRVTIDAVNIRLLADTSPWDWPDDAADLLKQTLRNNSASDRNIAAVLSGELVVMDDEMAELLLGIVSNSTESDDMRARAAIALGPVLEQTETDGFDDPLPEDLGEAPPITEQSFKKIKAMLRDLYKDQSVPKRVRQHVLEASVRAAADWHAEAIRTAYADADKGWKLTAVFAMRYVRGFEEEILQSLNSSNDEIHYQAIKAAGAHELNEAWPHIQGLLASQTTPRRLLLAAIWAAPYISPEEAGPALVDLSESKDQQIAEAAMEALGEAEVMHSGIDDEDQDYL
jgi:hypothetical protein